MSPSRAARISAILALFIAASSARAATLAKGTFELEPSAEFITQSLSGMGSGSQTTLTMLATLGYCTSDRLEVVVSPTVSHQSTPGFNATAIGALAGVRFNFSAQGNIVPFVGAALGVQKFSGDIGGSDASFVAPRVEGGIRLMMGSTAAVGFGAAYQHETSAFGVKDVSANDFQLTVGVSLFPGRTP